MCLFVALGLLLPRVALAVLWLLGKTDGVYHPWWLGLLGFLCLPYTTLAWFLLHWYRGGVPTDAATIVILVVAVLTDMGAWRGSGRVRRTRSEPA